MAEYIDKGAVLDELSIAFHTDKACFIRDAIKRVAEMPAADVRENKRGHWIKTEDGLIRCSECGHSRGELIAVHKPVDNDYVSKGGVLFNLVWENPYFCGKCGADMRKTCDGDQGREVEL